jgi:hypothetical protein
MGCFLSIKKKVFTPLGEMQTQTVVKCCLNVGTYIGYNSKQTLKKCLIKCCCDHSDDIKATLEETLL